MGDNNDDKIYIDAEPYKWPYNGNLKPSNTCFIVIGKFSLFLFIFRYGTAFLLLLFSFSTKHHLSRKRFCFICFFLFNERWLQSKIPSVPLADIIVEK